MRRRRFLTLAGAVSLAGCSGGESTPSASPSDGDTPTATVSPTDGSETPSAATDTPDDGTPTEAAVDTERAAEALSAARSELATATEAFGAEAVGLSKVTTAFAYDGETVTDATAAAETHAWTAIEVGDDGQVATAEAYFSLASCLRALGEAHTNLVTAAEAVQQATTEEADDRYEQAVATLDAARTAVGTAQSSLETARTRLRAFQRAVVDAALADPLTADLEAGMTVHAHLSVLALGRHARVSGIVDAEAGIDAFRTDDYSGATTAFTQAYKHFDDALAATDAYEGELMADAVADEQCLAEEYSAAAQTFQTASLEAESGNESEGFDIYRDGLSQYRNAPRHC